MYNNFDSCIFDFALERDPGDYWYDCAILEASDILRRFDKGDWARLLKELKNKDVFWKKRLVECLGDLHVAYELEVILHIINTSDEDLLVSCIDALRLLDLSKLGRRDQEELLLRVSFLLNEASPPVREILESFSGKLKS
ncbi:hypothetical protein [Pseudomonas nitroreducens]|uniref:hypothetical protein n=1 Tax=Pseudomonas nitroreducens TaxID=46680 RepID=UPI00187588A3|nr:hypothetical protein [Pseudomonas nitritireducens]